MAIRLTPVVRRNRRAGGPGWYGDARFSYQWALDNARSISEPLEDLQVGETKVVPMQNIKTSRYFQIEFNKAYFNNTPPTKELDKDDPNQDMTRIFNSIPKRIVKKGAMFLFGQQKFKGTQSFRINNDNLKKEWEKVWANNEMDSKVQDLGQRYLRDGDVFYKAVSRKVGKEVISEELVNKKKVMKTKEVGDIKFIRTSSGDWSSIVSNDNPDLVIAWVYQFERPDGVYIREEYYRDRTMYFEGKMFIEDNKPKNSQKMSPQVLQLSGLLKKDLPESNIEYELKEIDEHNLGTFPIVRFKNNEQNTFWGSSIYNGHYGQFDRLNETLTQLGYAIKMHSDPLLYVSGAEMSDQNVKASDAVWSFNNPDASLNILQWPGIPDSVFMFMDMLESQIFDDAFIPRTSEIEKIFSSENRVSGSALRELRSDIIEATLLRRQDVENGFRQMIELTALLSGTSLSEDEESIDVVWGPVFESGTAEKREALLNYRKNQIISRETVIDLSEDFPAEMKDSLKQDLAMIDQENKKMNESNNPSPDNTPSSPSKRRRKRN